MLLVTLGISLLVCFVRLYRGPNPPNRAVAFDLIAIHAVGIIALFAVRTEARALLTRPSSPPCSASWVP
ncbi:MAG: monovalent cation/H+ antiporter complex subunit F [Caldilineaceae bacterium]